MMILAGPAKVDLIFDRPHLIASPWLASAATLAAIDDHFWDWALWLGSKQLAGRRSGDRRAWQTAFASARPAGRSLRACQSGPGGRRVPGRS
jgi:hypothetical protein